jgi:hypothetical protein
VRCPAWLLSAKLPLIGSCRPPSPAFVGDALGRVMKRAPTRKEVASALSFPFWPESQYRLGTAKTSFPRTDSRGRMLCSPSSDSRSSCALRGRPKWRQTSQGAVHVAVNSSAGFECESIHAAVVARTGW